MKEVLIPFIRKIRPSIAWMKFRTLRALTYWILSAWLENFAFRIFINPLVFLLGGILAMAIALLTISYHTLRSARANPVRALRYE